MRVETHPGPQHTDQIQALDCPSLLRAGFAYTFIQPDEADKAQDRAFHSTEVLSSKIFPPLPSCGFEKL
jgi:hypothetical protein